MNDLDIYNACMSFCKLYGNVVAHRAQLDRARLLHNEMIAEQLEHNVKIEEGWLIDEFDHLYDAIIKYKEGK